MDTLIRKYHVRCTPKLLMLAVQASSAECVAVIVANGGADVEAEAALAVAFANDDYAIAQVMVGLRVPMPVDLQTDDVRWSRLFEVGRYRPDPWRIREMIAKLNQLMAGSAEECAWAKPCAGHEHYRPPKRLNPITSGVVDSPFKLDKVHQCQRGRQCRNLLMMPEDLVLVGGDERTDRDRPMFIAYYKGDVFCYIFDAAPNEMTFYLMMVSFCAWMGLRQEPGSWVFLHDYLGPTASELLREFCRRYGLLWAPCCRCLHDVRAEEDGFTLICKTVDSYKTVKDEIIPVSAILDCVEAVRQAGVFHDLDARVFRRARLVVAMAGGGLA
jgi:hypothetical protein